MFTPRKSKFIKQHKGRKYNKVYKPNTIIQMFKTVNVVLLKSDNYFRISEKLLSTIKQTLAKKIKRKGRFFIRLFADTPVSKKPLEIRMGKGKGAVEFWSAKLRPGYNFIELHGVEIKKAIKILKGIQKKLPIKTEVKLLLSTE